MFSIRKATQNDYQDIRNLIHTTVKACYPAIFATEIIRFYIEYHSLEEIHRRAITGVVLVLTIGDCIRATGFLSQGEMGGVYVHPDFQRQGLGLAIVSKLLEIARKKKLKKIWLDATPIAKPLYDKLGFELVRPMVIYIKNKPLHYFKMEKSL